jgi:hypothetical protein
MRLSAVAVLAVASLAVVPAATAAPPAGVGTGHSHTVRSIVRPVTSAGHARSGSP